MLLAFWLLPAIGSRAAASYFWTQLVGGTNASGTWGAATNWNNGAGPVADGADNTADFSTLDIGTLSTVTLDGARTIGNVIFGDTVPSTNWVLNASTTNATLPTTSALNLAVSSGAPVINVSNQVATFGAAIFSTNGFIKSGAGTLLLNNANTNASGSLSGLVIVTNGTLQCGNATLGVLGNQNGNNRAVVASGATLQVMPGIAVNNKHLTISGTGVGGTQGAIYASPATNTSSTRWGLSTVNDSGTSANSSASFPAILLADNSTIRVDGANYTYVFIAGYLTSGTNNFTLTKTGGGKLSLDRGANVSNLVVNAGSVAPNSPNGFGNVQTWTINSGGTILNWQGSCYSANAFMTVNAGGVWDINGRSDSAGTGYTETIGFLSGSGTITHGLNGATVATVLAVNNNSIFSGPIQVANGVLHLTKNTVDTTLTLSGTNTYNGITTINAGALLVDGRHIGGSNYVVNAGAVLSGKGTIIPNAPNSIGLSGTLAAGDNGGTLTVSNVFGFGDVYVTNANLVVLGQLNSSASGMTLNSLNLTNCAVSVPLQQSGTEASIYTSALNVDGTNNTLSFTTANPATGTFPFIKCSSLGGLNGFAGLTLQPPAGMAAYLSNNVAVDGTLYVVVTSIPALVWRGTPTGDWAIGGSANWWNGATPAAYTETAGQGPFVTFDDTAPGTASVNVATNLNPKGITVSSSTKNYTFSGSGSISSSGSVLKDGSSMLTLANSNALSGSISVLNGALAIGNGGTSGSIGTASVANSGQVIFDRSDDVSFGNVISGSGSLVKNNADMVTLTGVGNVGGTIAVNGGTLALGPSGTITVSGDVTGTGAFGINSAGRVILSSGNISYSGGSLIAGGGTLEFDNAFPPSGNILDNGTLALGAGGMFNGNISGPGGLTLLNGAFVTLGGANTYAGPTVVLGSGSLATAVANYSPASVLVLGSTNGAADSGSAAFTSGNPVLPGLIAGGNNSGNDAINLSAGTPQTLTVNGNVAIGNLGPVGATVYVPVTGTGASLNVNTNGGSIQIGLGATGSGVNPDNVFVDLSAIDNFSASLGTTGVINMGTLDGNPGPPAGATVVNQLKLAGISNSITAGTMTVGAGGRQLIPELILGPATNVFNLNTFNAGGGGRDGSYVHFDQATGGVRLRGYDSVSRAVLNVGVNPATGTGAGITNTVDFTGHPVDLLVSTLVIGNYNNAGAYQNTFSFDQGVLDALSTSLSVLRNNNANAALSSSTLNIGGGTASLGPVSLTASAAPGALNISNATVTVNSITTTGTGGSILNLTGSTLNLVLTSYGNPATAPIVANTFSASGSVKLAVNGAGWVVGQFPLISYTGSISGDGYPALNLISLPAGVTGYLSNYIANLSVDLVISKAPPTINPYPTNLTATLSGNVLTLGWDAGHLGWLLQSNGVSIVDTGAWVTIPGSGSTNLFSFPVDSGKVNAFFRMLRP